MNGTARKFPRLPAIPSSEAKQDMRLWGEENNRKWCRAMFSYPHPDINPAYYQAGSTEQLWEFSREAAEARAQAAAEELPKPNRQDDVSSKAPPPTALDAPRPVDARPKTYTEIVVNAARAHAQSGGAKESHPPAHKAPARLKHIKRVADQSGVVRIYYVRGPKPHIRLPDHEGTPVFLAAYEAARREKTRQWRLRQQPAKPARSVKDLVNLYLRSEAYARLAPDTQRVYDRVLRRLLYAEDIASCSAATLDRRRLQRHLDRHAGHPAAAEDLLKKLRVLVRCAIAHGWRSDDPTRGIKTPSGGRRRGWTSTEIAVFEARWAPGTRERTAYTLLLHTGRRGAEIAPMTWADIDRLGQSSELATALANWQRVHALILPTRMGKAFTPHSFGNLMTAAIAAAGLPPACTPDGLRRSSAII
ncbi:MAG: hypothetical protein NW205_03345 [Hyphomicrobiaceae bacterium]|nr:hypothetical protein [Hyphomicrobiaceae bacterium]